MKPIVHNGQVMSIEHLAPFDFTCPCDGLGRELVIRVHFHNHCYTMAFDDVAHTKEDILLYDAPTRPRVFDAVRHALSQGLPGIVSGLPGQKVNQTSRARNYVYGAPMQIAGQIYEVFFQIQREAKGGCDLRLTVESAYPVQQPFPLPKRPNAIRFNVLAYKVFRGQPVKFAPR